MAERRPIITLTTDFGEADYYVPAMKGVIHTINPAAEVIDLTHLIPPHDIYAAAFTLMCCYKEFPRGTVHVVVVDPGVGSSRRPIMVAAGDYHFVGPDNGVFSYVYQREQSRVVHLTADHYFRPNVSNTFHGRDVFAPVAAYASKLVDWQKMGEQISDPVRFNTPTAVVLSDRAIRGHVLHIDRFGNVITDITRDELTEERLKSGARVRIGSREAARVLSHFAEANKDELFAYFGSAGFLELAVPRSNAARLTEARRGVEVEVVIGQ
ncbi:MAG TPA: SAM-dependent chlorinase/fluorinase [Blastocatellia bacterium]|nr:SAM-dependent chlorinase/fluorinase [Blastocatellia bacterium]